MSESVTGTVQQFPGKGGWLYVELPEDLSTDLRPIVAQTWPALLRCTFTTGKTTWQSSIMPIKDGPLFIALPAAVRKKEGIVVGATITVKFTTLD